MHLVTVKQNYTLLDISQPRIKRLPPTPETFIAKMQMITGDRLLEIAVPVQKHIAYICEFDTFHSFNPSCKN